MYQEICEGYNEVTYKDFVDLYTRKLDFYSKLMKYVLMKLVCKDYLLRYLTSLNMFAWAIC